MNLDVHHDPYLALRDDAAAGDAVGARSRERALRERATEVATWVGTLRDLAERATTVVVRTRRRLAHRGGLAAVGVDHLALRLANGGFVLVAFDEVCTVRPEPGAAAPVAMGDRARSQDRTLVEALARLLEVQQRVVVGIRDVPEPLNGRVLGLGEDVLSLRLDGAGGGVVYVPVAAVREIGIEP